MAQVPIKIAHWPCYAEDEIEAVREVLHSGKPNYWGGGKCIEFEELFAQWVGAKHGLSVFNGTQALEIALKAAGIQHGDEVVVTPRSFLASAAAVVAVGGIPVFADVDYESGNLTAETIREVLTDKTKGILVVHLGGWPADMNDIMELANAKGLIVIEDCAQSHGATYHGQRVGSIGHVAAFSFCQDKIMSTGGEGGMITTNDSKIRDIAWSLRDHGRDRQMTLSDNHPPGFRWLQTRFATNARMTEMQAAIGLVQLQKVDDWVYQRKQNSEMFASFLQEVEGCYIPSPPPDVSHAYYRLSVILDTESNRNDFIVQLNSLGVNASIGPCPEIYKETAFVEAPFETPIELSIAHKLGKVTMALPVHPGMEHSISLIMEEIDVIHA